MKASRESILDFIARFTTEHGYPPTVREIARGVGLRSVSGVMRSLDILEANGLIQRDAATARSIRVVAA